MSIPNAPTHESRIQNLERVVLALAALYKANKLDPKFHKDFAQLQAVVAAFNEHDFDKTEQLIGELDGKYAPIVRRLGHIEAEQKRLHRGLTSAHQRSAQLEVRVAKLEEIGIDKQTLSGASQAGATSDKRSFVRYMTSHGVSPQQLREFFNLVSLEGDDAPLELDNEEIFHELMTELMHQLPEVNQRITVLEDRVGEQDTRLDAMSTKVDSYDTRITEVANSAGEGSTSKWPLVIALIAAIISWPIIVSATNDTPREGMTAEELADLTNKSGWWQFCAILAVFFGTLAVVSFFGRFVRTKSSKTTKTDIVRRHLSETRKELA